MIDLSVLLLEKCNALVSKYDLWRATMLTSRSINLNYQGQ